VLPVAINIFLIKVNVLQTGAALNVGQNFLPDWTAFSKTNSGTGSQYGDASNMWGKDICLDDADLVDMPVYQRRGLLTERAGKG